MKIVNFILAIMFIWFAELQLNDPDPVIWILIYGSMAVVCVMAAFDYYLRPLFLIQFAGYIIYAIILLPGVIEWFGTPDRAQLFDELAKMEHLYIEEAREFLGLMICVAVLVMHWIRSTRALKKTSP